MLDFISRFHNAWRIATIEAEVDRKHKGKVRSLRSERRQRERKQRAYKKVLLRLWKLRAALCKAEHRHHETLWCQNLYAHVCQYCGLTYSHDDLMKLINVEPEKCDCEVCAVREHLYGKGDTDE